MCDLCFFNSLQSRAAHLKRGGKNNTDLIAAINTAWQEYDSDTLARSYGVLFAVYRLILLNFGDNRFDTPHSGVRDDWENEVDFEDQKLTNDDILQVTQWLSEHTE